MVDGNKRIGTHVMLVLLALNGIELVYTRKEFYENIPDVAEGKQRLEFQKFTELLGHKKEIGLCIP